MLTQVVRLRGALMAPDACAMIQAFPEVLDVPEYEGIGEMRRLLRLYSAYCEEWTRAGPNLDVDMGYWT